MLPRMDEEVPLFQLEKLFELRVDPWDDVIERRRDAATTAAAAASSTSPPRPSPSGKTTTIVASAFKKVGDASILAVVVESNSILLRHWLSDGSEHKMKELMWFRSGQLRIRGLCFDPSGNWLLAVTADGRLYLLAALHMLDSNAPTDCTWPTDDLICISEDLELEGRPSAVCWWDSLDNRKTAIVGTDSDELVFVDLKSRRLLLRLRLHVGVADLVVVDVAVIANDAQSQTALLITQEARRRGSGDASVTPTRVGFSDCSLKQQPQRRQMQQSRLVLEKRMESNVTSFPPLDPNFAEDYVFQGLFSILDPLDPSLPLPKPNSLPKISDGSGKYAQAQFSKGHHFLSIFDPLHRRLEVWDPELNQSTAAFQFQLPHRVTKVLLTDHLLACAVDAGDRDEIHFLSRHLASDAIDSSNNVDEAASPKSTPSLSMSSSSATCSSSKRKTDGGATDDDWSFPRTLQRIRLPPGERLSSMDKMAFPFYFHDDGGGVAPRGPRDVGKNRVVDDVGDLQNAHFGWSFPYLRFSSPTVLDGCLLVTENMAFLISPRLSPERLAFELCQIPPPSVSPLSFSSSRPTPFTHHRNIPAEGFATALGLDCSASFEAAREFCLIRPRDSLPASKGDSSKRKLPLPPLFPPPPPLSGDRNDGRLARSFLLFIEHGRYEEALRLSSKDVFDDAFGVGGVQVPPKWLVDAPPPDEAGILDRCRRLYFRILVAMVRKHLLDSSSYHSSSSSHSSSPWTAESIARFLDSSCFSSVDLGFIISVLLEHDFLQLAFDVARSRQKLDAFLRLFVRRNEESGRGGGFKDDHELPSLPGDMAIRSSCADNSRGVPDNDGRVRGNFPWRLLLFEADLSPTECWIFVHFVEGVDGLLEGFLVGADDEQLGALFRILSSSFALFINSLRLILRIVTRLNEENLNRIIRFSRILPPPLPLPPHPFAVSPVASSFTEYLTTLSLCAEIALVARSTTEAGMTASSSSSSTTVRPENIASVDEGASISFPDDAVETTNSTSSLPLPLETNSLSAGYDGVVVILAADKNAADDSNSSRMFISSSSRSASPTFTTLPYGVDSVSCGASHTLALACGGSVLLSWGSDAYGQLGIGGATADVKFMETPTPVVRGEDGDLPAWWSSVECGGYHSLALTRDGRLFSWGWGVHGQLALGGVVDVNRPRRVADDIKAMSAGHAHSAYVTSSGQLFLVGSNHFGQLGIGDGDTKKLKTPVRLRFEGDGTEGDDDEEESTQGTRVLSVSCGLFHTLALVERGGSQDDVSTAALSVYTWGRHPVVLKSTMRGAQGRKHLTPSVLKIPSMVGRVSRLCAGGRHNVLLTEDGEVLVWGSNAEGQLGNGNNLDSQEPSMMVALNDRKMSRVGVGVDFSLAADEDGNVFVWGKKDVVQHMQEMTTTTTMTPRRSADTDRPVRQWREKTIGMKIKKKEAERATMSMNKRPRHPLPVGYPPPPSALSPFILRLSSLDPDHDYDWRKLLSVALRLESNALQDQTPPSTLSRRSSSVSLGPLVAYLYWLRGMKSLCLASLLNEDGLTEEEAADLICRHFAACVSDDDGGDGDQMREDFTSSVSWIFSFWSSKNFATSTLETCLTSAFEAAPSLRHCLLHHIKTTSTIGDDNNPRFSVGFLTRLFLAVMEEEEEGSERKEEVGEKGAATTRLWNAIHNNLKREVGKRKRAICLSAAQVEALGSNARSARNDFGEGVYFFSCGHHYKTAELRQYFSSPSSSASFVSSSLASWPIDQNDALLHLYEQMRDFKPRSLACPACLTQSLKTMAID